MAKQEIKRIKTPKFRLSFPCLVNPEKMEGAAGDPKYSVVMLFAKDKKADWQPLYDLVLEVAKKKFGTTPDGKLKKPNGFRNPFRDGDEERGETDGYAGHIFVKASTRIKPGIVDNNCVPVSDPAAAYAGMYCKAYVSAFAYDNASKGVSIQLEALQLVSDGEPFGGSGVNASEVFTPEEGGVTAPAAGQGSDDL